MVIEEFLEGDELSILSFSDGYTIQSLPPAQDHKRIFDGDLGPNTGGMGCYAPTNIATKRLIEEIERTILQPTIDGMRKDRMPFVGTLFTGIIVTKDGPKVLEYNVRFGDPETQTLLPLLETDLAEIMVACCEKWLDAVSIKVDPKKSSATVVVAANGYPSSYAKGAAITVKTPPEDTNIFHAGTTLRDGQLQTNGGRVIASQAVAEGLQEAVKRAYVGRYIKLFLLDAYQCSKLFGSFEHLSYRARNSSLQDNHCSQMLTSNRCGIYQIRQNVLPQRYCAQSF